MSVFKKPDCSDCHEDEMNYPDDLPGTLLKVKSASLKLNNDLPNTSLTAPESALKRHRLSPRSRMKE
jgi:hypothetical protein